MIGLDTNVLVRYVAQDDPVQTPAANEIIDGLDESRPGYVTMIVLVEMYWVLSRAYKMDTTSIAKILYGVLDSAEILVEQPDAVRRALRRVDDGADFADALINQLGADAGCDFTVTFDQKAAKVAGMRLMGH